MVMSAQSAGSLINRGNSPVPPPRRCRNKDIYSNTATQESLSAWVSTHPRVKRSTSETTTNTTTSNNCCSRSSSSVKTVSLERTRSKGLPPSPVVRQPVSKRRTVSPATIPRLPPKRSSQISVQKVSDISVDPLPNLPAKKIPRLPPKKNKASNLNSGILNPLDKKELAEENSIPDSDDSSVPDYEDIKPIVSEVIKDTQNKDNKTCCSLLPKKLEVIKESTPQQVPSLDYFNTLPKLPSQRPSLPPKSRTLPEVKGVPPVPKKRYLSHKESELSCFTTSSSRYLDLSNMNKILPSITGTFITETRTLISEPHSSVSALLADDTNKNRNPVSKSDSSLSSFLADDANKDEKPIGKSEGSLSSFSADDKNDNDLLHDDSYEPDFGHLVLLQGGVEAIHAALSARKEKRSAQKRAVTVTEKSQLTLEMDNKLDDAGYEVPASEDKNCSNDSDPTYEEVAFRSGRECKPKTEQATRCCGNPSAFFNLLTAVFVMFVLKLSLHTFGLPSAVWSVLIVLWSLACMKCGIVCFACCVRFPLK